MGCGTSFVKYVLFFFNLFFALVGLAMVGLGVAVLMNWSAMKDLLQGNLTVAPWLFIVVGAVVFVIAFFGCCGAIRESHCMVVTYAIFLLVIIIVQISLAVIMFVYSESLTAALTNSVDKIFRTAQSGDPAARTTFDSIELQLKCCGANGPTDYLAVSLPKSCCSREGIIGHYTGACTIAEAKTTGCAKQVGDLYQKWNNTIAGVAIAVACVEVLGSLFALCLANSIRNMDRRSRY